MNVAAAILSAVTLVIIVVATILNIRQYKKVLKKLGEQEARIRSLEEHAWIRGSKGRFQRLVPPQVKAAAE